MSTNEVPQVGRGRLAIVVGCGPAGALMSLYLARMGWMVETYEKKELYDKRGAEGYIVPRGYDIMLCSRGFDAIETAGVTIGSSKCVKLTHIIFHAGKVGKYTKVPFMGDGNAAFNRDVLGAALREEGLRLYPEQISYHYEHKLSKVDFEGQTVTFDKGGSTVTRRYDLLVGCDGVWSGVRGAMEKRGLISYQHVRNPGKHWTAELGRMSEMPGADKTWESSWHIWINPVPGSVLAIVPTPDGRSRLGFGVFHEKSAPFEDLKTDAAVEEWFRKTFPDFLEGREVPEGWVRGFLEQAPNHNGVEVKCSAFDAAGNVVLVGDSAHSVFPIQGLGCNTALESCRILSDVLIEHDGDLELALPAFTAARKPQTDAAAAMSRREFFSVGAQMRYVVLKGLHWALPFIFAEPAEDKGRHARSCYRAVRSLQRWQDAQLVLLPIMLVGAGLLTLMRR